MNKHIDVGQGVWARIVDIPGARNLRELGGYTMADGRRIKLGKIYRSGHAGGIAAADLPRLCNLRLASIVDLRTTDERAALPFPVSLTNGLRYWARDYDFSRGDIVRILRDPATDCVIMRSQMIETYRHLVKEQHEGIAMALRLLLEGAAPVLINCTAGKDRTGVVCAIVLAALGADQTLIRQDYALTERLHDPADQLFHVEPNGPFSYLSEVDPEVWRTMMCSDPKYIDATFAEINQLHGDVGRYLQRAHGLGPKQLDRLRTLLLEN